MTEIADHMLSIVFAISGRERCGFESNLWGNPAAMRKVLLHRFHISVRHLLD
jgi:hypothetical protein